MENLVKIIACRHGDYSNESGSLIPAGIQQVQQLTKSISPLISSGSKVVLFTSPRKRAVETATIISQALEGVAPMVCESLQYDGYSDREGVFNEVVQRISDQEVLLLVTHYDLPSGIIHAFSEKHLQKPFPRTTIKKGQGIVLHLKTGQVSFIP